MKRALAAIVAVVLLGALEEARAQMSPSLLKQASGMVMPNESLPTGSLRVRLRSWAGEDTEAPALTGERVDLVTFREGMKPAVRSQVTDADGSTTFLDLPREEQHRVEAMYQGVRYQSQMFASPESGGLMLVLLAYPATRDLSAASIDNMLVRVQGETDGVRLIEAMKLMATGDRALDFGPEGLRITLPEAAHDVRVSLDAEGKIPDPGGEVGDGPVVILNGGLPPAVPRPVIISYRLEPAAQVELSWQLPLPVKDVEVQVPTLVSMRLEKSSLGAVQSMSGWQVCHGNDIPADRPVSVTIANVPPASELFTDDPSVIQLTISYQVVEFREQQNGLWAGVYQVCELGNSSKRIYRNASGIYLGMPRDFAGNPQLEDNGPDVTLVPKRGVGVSGPVAPGGRTVKFGYFLPTKGGQLVHTQTTSSKIDSYNVAAIARPGLTISGAGLSPTEERPAPHGSSEKILVAFSSASVAAGSSFTFTMDGLPAETAHGPLGVTIAGGLFALGAIVAGERWRRSARRRGERAALEQDRERLFGELVGLEAGHGQGQVGDDAYRSRRGTLMNQLESVTLKLSEVP